MRKHIYPQKLQMSSKDYILSAEIEFIWKINCETKFENDTRKTILREKFAQKILTFYYKQNKIVFSIYIKRCFGQILFEKLRSKFLSRKQYQVLTSPRFWNFILKTTLQSQSSNFDRKEGIFTNQTNAECKTIIPVGLLVRT